MPGYLDVRRPVGDAERLGDRHQRRGPGDHGRLLRACTAARAGRDRSCCASAPSSTPNLAIGTRVTNTGVRHVEQPTQTASASVSIDVGGMAGVGVLNGTAWHDANFDNALDGNERALEGWTVELYRNGELVHTALTDASGVYQISGVAPNYATMDHYELRFRAPGAGRSTAMLGRAALDASRTACSGSPTSSCAPGSNLQNLESADRPERRRLRLDRAHADRGRDADAAGRGRRAALPSSCFDDPAQQGQVTLATATTSSTSTSPTRLSQRRQLRGRA